MHGRDQRSDDQADLADYPVLVTAMSEAARRTGSYRPAPGDLSPFDVSDLPPTLVVVVDTEEEFDWSGPFDPANTSVSNVQEQWRAQEVFREFGVIPTYCVTYPVATDAKATAVLKQFVRDGDAAIGSHLHPWVTPPGLAPVGSWLSYPGNYPRTIERRKLVALTEAVEDGFGRRPVVYQAGRYGFGPHTADLLHELGYVVDGSMVPFTDFSKDGGPDYSRLDGRPVRFRSGVVSLPLSVHFAGWLRKGGARLYPMLAEGVGRRLRLSGVAARLGMLERLRLTPEGHRGVEMRRQVRAGLAQGTRVFLMTYHSSSLLPGATPYVGDAAGRSRLLDSVRGLLDMFMAQPGARTMDIATLARTLVARQGAAEAGGAEAR